MIENNDIKEKDLKDLDDVCYECKKKDESVSQNLILTGFKLCNSCRISKTIFPVPGIGAFCLEQMPKINPTSVVERHHKKRYPPGTQFAAQNLGISTPGPPRIHKHMPKHVFLARPSVDEK